jgi:hypothetical protein
MYLLNNAPRRIILSTAVILLLSASTFFAIGVRPSSGAVATANTGVLIPLYNRPDSTWTAVVQARSTYPNVPIAVIVNPNNGPGASSDPAFLTGIQSLQAAGVTVLGYVDMLTGGGTLPPKTVVAAEAQVDEYHSWYAANGIFFDDFNNGFTYSPATYASLNTYVKAHGMTYTMGNPGTSVSSGYIGTLDNLVIYESSGYPSISSISFAGYPKSDFSVIAFGVSYDAAFVASAFPNVAYMYLDNLSGGNPYLTLTSLFLQTEATLNTLDVDPPLTSTTSASQTSTTTVTASSSSATTTSVTTAPAATSQLTVSSMTTAGTAITGFWTQLMDPSLNVLATGYTPIGYVLNNGQAYTLEADSYGACLFDHWQDGGTMNGLRDIAIATSTNLVAVYNCGTTSTTTTTSTSTTATKSSSTTTTATSTSTTAAAPGHVTITVRSVNLAGATFSGMWATIHSASGKTLARGYTTLGYTGPSGASYNVCVFNYLTTTFSHWGDGSTNPCKTVTPTSSTLLTAFYNTG